jgi:hypothetical protein
MRSLLPSFLCLAAACSARPGAPSSPDAGDPPDAGPSPVTVDSIPAGAVALFYDADGALLARVTPDMYGSASAVVPAGGAVTIAAPPPSDMITFLDVAPGDHLHAQRVRPSTTGHPIDVTLPAIGGTGTGNASIVGAFVDDCGGDVPNGAPATLHCRLDDGAPATDTILVEASSGVNQPMHYLVAKDIPVAPQGSIDLSSRAWTAGQAWPDLTVADAAGDSIDGTGASYAVMAGDHVAFEWINLAVVHGDLPFYDGGPDRTGFGNSIAMLVELTAPGASAPHEQLALRARDVGATIDLDRYALPSLTAATLSPTGDVTWKATSSTTAPVAVAIDVVLDTPGSWTVFARPERTSLHLPPLPSDLAWPKPPIGIAASYLGSDDGGGYDAFRADPSAADLRGFTDEMPRHPGGYHAVRWN